MNTCSVCQ
jgi:hypothetical protein